jgi:aconitase A
MTRGTFANIRIKNLMLPAATEGGITTAPARRAATMSIYDAPCSLPGQRARR